MKCFKCFKEYESGTICPHCGYENKDEKSEMRCLEKGSLLQNGKYLVGAVIGAGGFGVTYAAFDQRLQMRVAIKEYLPGEFSTRCVGNQTVSIYGGEKEEQFHEGLKKFLDESRRLAKFQRVPGIVQIFDVFEENETAYIVMEYLEGETLGERLKRESKIDYHEAIEIMTPILQALQSVHQEGILHRDIAPNNIFLCSNGEVKLLDFGAARSATGTYSKSLTVLYKDGYTPEEQYRSRGNQGPWTDVYACAATLYKMLTGVVPEGAMERRRKDTLKEPSKQGIKIPDYIDKSIMNALNLEIQNRTQSTAQFLEELLGEKSVDNRFKRAKEKQVDRIPLWVWISSGSAVVGAVVFLVLLLTGQFHFVDGFTNLFLAKGEVRVINVVNMEEQQAEEKLQKVGLIMEIEDYRYSNKIEEGKIIVQEEKRGSVVKEGSIIHVVVSKGAGNVSVPDFVGLSQEQVQEKLEELCLEYEIEEISSIEAPGYVAEQDIASGTVIEQGNTIRLKVSKGNGYDKQGQITLDDITGRDYQAEKNRLRNQQVYLQITEYQYSDDLQKGTIVSQSKDAGTTITGADVLEVVVSAGLEPMEVPEMVSKMIEEATALLENVYLTPKIKYVVDQSKEEGLVLSQEVKSGDFVDKFSEIPIEVCSHGSVVPNFSGKTEAEAQALAEENNLTISIKRVFEGNNTIIAQDISAGEVVDLNSNVDLQLGIPRNEFTSELVEKINALRRNNGFNTVSLSGTWSGYAQDLAPRTPEGTSFDYGSYVKSPYNYFYWTWFSVSDTDTAAAKLMTYPHARRNFDVIGIGYSGGTASILLSDT